MPQALPADVRAELRSLPAAVADRVASHLVAAGSAYRRANPPPSLRHARAARQLARRTAACREAVGLCAYEAGEYGEALAELRAARRMNGSGEHLAVMADCERGLGRPERALRYLDDPDAGRLDPAAFAELRIVASGARRDLSQPEAGLALLDGADLRSTVVQPWTSRLWYAYAEALLACGRRDEAAEWFAAVEAVDEGDTNAAERLAALMPAAGFRGERSASRAKMRNPEASAGLQGVLPTLPAGVWL